jgi:hypothetical protein
MYAGLIIVLAGGLGICIGIWLKSWLDSRRGPNGLEQRRQLYDRFGKLAYATLRGGAFPSTEFHVYAEALAPVVPAQVMAAVNDLIQELSKWRGPSEDSDARAAYGAWQSYLHAISEDLGFQSDRHVTKP